MTNDETHLHCKACPFVLPRSAGDSEFARGGGCDRVCLYLTIVLGERTPIDQIPEEMRDRSTVH